METVIRHQAQSPAVAAPALLPVDAGRPDSRRLPVLDGWRALSILSVLAAHMLPLGPKSTRMNECAALMGMSMFFTLSGFLITTNLYTHRNVIAFFIRRACRILPLAYLFMAFVFVFLKTEPVHWLYHFGFLTNYASEHVTALTSHLWSVCVEVHFYLLIGLLMAATRFRAFGLLPLGLAGVIGLRVWIGVHESNKTLFRVDEILAGGCLAMVYAGAWGGRIKDLIIRAPWPVLLPALVVSCHPNAGWCQYLRPVAASALIGHTLLAPGPDRYRWLRHRALQYVAEISYALYIIHPLTVYGWFNEGSRGMRYAKRPLSLAMSFGLAHVSTFYYERYWIGLGKRWSQTATSGRGRNKAMADSVRA